MTHVVLECWLVSNKYSMCVGLSGCCVSYVGGHVVSYSITMSWGLVSLHNWTTPVQCRSCVVQCPWCCWCCLHSGVSDGNPRNRWRWPFQMNLMIRKISFAGSWWINDREPEVLPWHFWGFRSRGCLFPKLGLSRVHRFTKWSHLHQWLPFHSA